MAAWASNWRQAPWTWPFPSGRASAGPASASCRSYGGVVIRMWTDRAPSQRPASTSAPASWTWNGARNSLFRPGGRTRTAPAPIWPAPCPTALTPRGVWPDSFPEAALAPADSNPGLPTWGPARRAISSWDWPRAVWIRAGSPGPLRPRSWPSTAIWPTCIALRSPWSGTESGGPITAFQPSMTASAMPSRSPTVRVPDSRPAEGPQSSRSPSTTPGRSRRHRPWGTEQALARVRPSRRPSTSTTVRQRDPGLPSPLERSYGKRAPSANRLPRHSCAICNPFGSPTRPPTNP